jgi:predicted MFS family arabinose efflux permease
MISDYFPPEKRSTALSIYSTGIYFGILIGFLMGGYLNQHLGWRTAFFVLGIPGIIFSFLFYITVKEPRRGATDKNKVAANEAHSFGKVLRFLFSTRTFPFLALATGLHVFCIYGLFNWAPSFLSRIHGMKNDTIGATLGPILGIGGAIGSFAGGWLTDYLGKKDTRQYLKVPAWAIIFSIVFAAAGLFLKNTFSSILCLGLCASLQSMYLGPSIAVVHRLVSASMRSLASAVLFLVLNLIGLGLGPLVVGLVSDMLSPTLGTQSLRWAMSIIIVVGLAAAILFFVSAKKLAADLRLEK